jgi:DNA-binding MarR family transcriptional regulator
VQVRNSQFEKSLLNKVARVANSLEREVENELKDSLELSFSQLRVLNGLKVMGESSQAAIAAALGVTPAVITRQANALRRRGLVELHPKTKRENLMALTEKGAGALKTGLAKIEECQIRILKPLPAEDEVSFARYVDILDRSLA